MVRPLPLSILSLTRFKAGGNGAMILNGEAWKSRGDTTYTSLLDIYGVSNLFSQESIELYAESKEEKDSRQEELTEFLFSGRMQAQSKEENIVEQIFAEEIHLSRVQNYSRSTNDYTISLVLAEILFVLVFLCLLMRWNAARREKRKEHAAEIDI